MQFKVPQNVQKEDRIVGFLTFKQLIIVIIGGTIAYGIYAVLERQGIPTIIWAVPVAFILLLTAAFAFLKISNLPFHAYLALLIERLLVPSKRVWVKGADRVIGDEEYETPEEVKIRKAKEEKKSTQKHKESQIEKIGNISSIVDRNLQQKTESHKKIEDIDETEDENLLQKAFLDEKPRKKKRKKNKEKTGVDKIIELSAQGDKKQEAQETTQAQNNSRKPVQQQKEEKKETEQAVKPDTGAQETTQKSETVEEKKPVPNISLEKEKNSPDKEQASEEEKPKKKRRRRRRKKKKPQEQTKQITENPSEKADEPKQVKTLEKKPTELNSQESRAEKNTISTPKPRAHQEELKSENKSINVSEIAKPKEGEDSPKTTESPTPLQTAKNTPDEQVEVKETTPQNDPNTAKSVPQAEQQQQQQQSAHPSPIPQALHQEPKPISPLPAKTTGELEEGQEIRFP